MRLSLAAALLAVAVAAGATPASACVFSLFCSEGVIDDDAYPMGQPGLSPHVQEVVAARDGKGMSLAGFYNDPSLALQPRQDAGFAPPPPPLFAPQGAVVDATPAPVEYEPRYDRRRRHGPHLVASRYGRPHAAHAAADSPRRY